MISLIYNKNNTKIRINHDIRFFSQKYHFHILTLMNKYFLSPFNSSLNVQLPFTH